MNRFLYLFISDNNRKIYKLYKNNETMNKIIHEGTLEILSREAFPIQSINSRKKTPVTEIRINLGNEQYYSTKIFGYIPSRYNNKKVILREYQKDKKNGGIIKDKLFLARQDEKDKRNDNIIREGLFLARRVIPITSRRRYRENNYLI